MVPLYTLNVHCVRGEGDMLSITEAARQLGCSRTTLYKLIKDGRLSQRPDGSIDPSECARVASTLKRSYVQTLRAEQITMDSILPDDNPKGVQNSTSSKNVHTANIGQASTSSFERLIVHLEQELERMHDQLAWFQQKLERADEREADLRRMLEAAHQQNQRLIEQRSVVGRAGERPARHPSGLSSNHERVLAVMEKGREYTTQEIGSLAGLTGRQPRDILDRMVKNRLIERISPGVFRRMG